jgi:2Fe-2S ferredoxin
MISIKVTDLDGQQHDVKANEGESLMEALRHDEWGVAAICGGLCSCGTCHVYVDTDWLDKFQQADSDELDLLDVFDTTKDNSRLSCQLYIQATHEGLKLSIAPED